MRGCCVLVLVAGVLTACPPPVVEATADAFVDAELAWAERCSDGGFFGRAEPVGFAHVKAQSLAARRSVLEGIVANDNVVFDAAAAATCIEALSTASCVTNTFGFADTAAVDACDGVLTGSVANGGGCALAIECADTTASCFGTDENGCGGTCTPRAAIGEACTASDCVDGASCSEGVCVALRPFVAAGEACDPRADVCVDGFQCIDEVCAAVNIADVGEACSQTEYCINQSTKNACVDDVCTARPGVGDACTGACDAEAAFCGDDGVCAALGTTGAACDSSSACSVELTCTDGACAAVVAEDAPVCSDA